MRTDGWKGVAGNEKALADFQTKVEAVINNAMGWDKLRPLYIKLYMDAYTEEELDGIVTFYKSPAGQAMVSKSFGLVADAPKRPSWNADSFFRRFVQ